MFLNLLECFTSSAFSYILLLKFLVCYKFNIFSLGHSLYLFLPRVTWCFACFSKSDICFISQFFTVEVFLKQFLLSADLKSKEWAFFCKRMVGRYRMKFSTWWWTKLCFLSLAIVSIRNCVFLWVGKISFKFDWLMSVVILAKKSQT